MASGGSVLASGRSGSLGLVAGRGEGLGGSAPIVSSLSLAVKVMVLGEKLGPVSLWVLGESTFLVVVCLVAPKIGLPDLALFPFWGSEDLTLVLILSKKWIQGLSEKVSPLKGDSHVLSLCSLVYLPVA